MLTIRDIMTRDVITVPPEASIRDAMRLLVERSVSGLPVVAGRRVVGVVSVTDLLDFAASLPEPVAEVGVPEELGPVEMWEDGTEPPAAYFSEMWPETSAELETRFAATERPEWDVLEEHTVAEVMNRAVCALPPTASVPAAADYMRRAGIHRILVMEDEQLLGIVSAKDIARAVGERQLIDRRPVFDAERLFDERGW
jgi:CBS domain-containing protein